MAYEAELDWEASMLSADVQSYCRRLAEIASEVSRPDGDFEFHIWPIPRDEEVTTVCIGVWGEPSAIAALERALREEDMLA